MIVFNTLKKAEHYVKHLASRKTLDPYDYEHFQGYEIRDHKVLSVWGWNCGCGCGRGYTCATVIGRIKSQKP